jgi:predicted nucleic-acid-binding protein
MGRRALKVIADTNLLVRAAVGDDPVQSPLARRELTDAALVALTLPALCDLAWVLRSHYRSSRETVAATIRAFADGSTAVTDREAVEAGLAMLESDGDFADGVIAEQGLRLGGEVFVSFDRAAVRLLSGHGRLCRTPD